MMNVLEQVISFIADQNIDAYFVGGHVRDELLPRRVKRDVDLAIHGAAIELARAFAARYGGALYVMDEEHDVARVILRGTYVDFAAMRGSLRDDLKTRDFTINAMARQLGSDELTDPFRGLQHLREKKIVAVSDQVFRDDPVRLLRAIRFAGELEFGIDARTERLIERDARLVAYAAKERARDEFCRILALENPSRWLRRADALGLLTALLPEFDGMKKTTQSTPHVYNVFDHTLRVLDELEKLQGKNYAEVAGGAFISELQSHFRRSVSGDHSRALIIRLAALLHDIGKPITRSVDDKGMIRFIEHESRGAALAVPLLHRLRFSNDEIELTKKVILHHLRPTLLADEPKLTNRAAYRFFRETGDVGIDVCTLALADRRGTYAREARNKNDARILETVKTLLHRYFRDRERVLAPSPLVDGGALVKALRLAPGPIIGKLLEEIREAQVEGKVKTRTQAIAYARRLSAESVGKTKKAAAPRTTEHKPTKSMRRAEKRGARKRKKPKSRSNV